MKIGIDARLIRETGVGRYIRNLIHELSLIDTENDYRVFLRRESSGGFVPPNGHWQIRRADIPWHSVTEQILLPYIFMREHLDLLHVPYFTIPLLYPGRLVVTIHDLTILHFDTGKASTLPLPLYTARRYGYRTVLRLGLMKAGKIIAVSESTKDEIIAHYHTPPDKIVVTREGVGIPAGGDGGQRPLPYPYLLYVGNAYPHKNLETLLLAYRMVLRKKLHHRSGIHLVLAGPKDYFSERLAKTVGAQGIGDHVHFMTGVADHELGILYRHATAFVFPSRMEGFGLPGLEAMALGIPVLCSDIPVFHEIYNDAALYFDPYQPAAIADTILSVIGDSALRSRLKKKGEAQAGKYSWSNLARATLAVYRSCLGEKI
ncbi:glycosyltransferase family 4 protein [Patescibacteria group bacterium]|nr:glycosyltransferase family 4 protein [Patescibacteria group bacterium]